MRGSIFRGLWSCGNPCVFIYRSGYQKSDRGSRI